MSLPLKRSELKEGAMDTEPISLKCKIAEYEIYFDNRGEKRARLKLFHLVRDILPAIEVDLPDEDWFGGAFMGQTTVAYFTPPGARPFLKISID